MSIVANYDVDRVKLFHAAISLWHQGGDIAITTCLRNVTLCYANKGQQVGWFLLIAHVLKNM